MSNTRNDSRTNVVVHLAHASEAPAVDLYEVDRGFLAALAFDADCARIAVVGDAAGLLEHLEDAAQAIRNGLTAAYVEDTA